MKEKQVLITGGNGFLGSHLVSYLTRKGNYSIVVFDRIPAQNTVQGDILSRSDLEKVFLEYGPFDTVFHLASAMPDRSFSEEMTWKINVDGTRNMISSAMKHNVKSLIFTSSNVTYGVPKILPVTEDTQLRPIEVYGRSKAQAEKELEKFRGKINIQIFRCPVITGIGRLGLQSILFEFISEGKNVYVLGNGSNTYQFVDATDVCMALEKASKMKGFDVYTIGGDGVMTIRELYEAVIAHAQSKSKIVSLPKTVSLLTLSLLNWLGISPLGIYQYTMIGRSLWQDTSKIKRKLGWKPKTTNEDSFIKNYDWYLQNKKTFVEVGSEGVSANRSLPKMRIFKLLKFLS